MRASVLRGRETVTRGTRKTVAAALAIIVVVSGCGAPAQEPVVTSVAPTDIDIAAKRAAELAGYAKFLGLDDPPEVAPVKYVTLETQDAHIKACMSEQGFEPDSEGAYGAPTGQMTVLNTALYVCSASYPLEDKYERPYSIEQKRIIYDYFVGSLVPCLTEHGFTPPEAPSFETFLATAGTAEEYNPFQVALATADAETVERVAAECPLLPPTSELFG